MLEMLNNHMHWILEIETKMRMHGNVQTEEHRAKLVNELLEGELEEKKKAQSKAQKKRAKQAKERAKAHALCNGGRSEKKEEKEQEEKMEEPPEEGALPSSAALEETHFFEKYSQRHRRPVVILLGRLKVLSSWHHIWGLGPNDPPFSAKSCMHVEMRMCILITTLLRNIKS